MGNKCFSSFNDYKVKDAEARNRLTALEHITVSPRLYGAVCDGVTDDTQAVLSACATGNPVFAENCYISDCEISNAIIHMKNCVVNKVKLTNCVLSGSCTTGISTTGINAGDNTIIENCTILNPGLKDPTTECSGAGIYITGKNVTVSNCIIDAYYSSIHVGNDNAKILNCRFLDCKTMETKGVMEGGDGGIKVGRVTDPTEDDPYAPRNLLVEGCVFGDSTNPSISFWVGAYSATVRNCIFESKRKSNGEAKQYIQIKSYNKDRGDGLGCNTFHDYTEKLNIERCIFKHNIAVACMKNVTDLENYPDIGTTDITFDGCSFYASNLWIDGAEMIKVANCTYEGDSAFFVNLSNTANTPADRYHTLLFENNIVKSNAITSSGDYNLFLYNNLIDAPYCGVRVNDSEANKSISRVVSKNNRIFTTDSTAFGYLDVMGVFLSTDDQFNAKTFVQLKNNANVSIKNLMCEMYASRPIDCNNHTVSGEISYIHKSDIPIAQMINGANATITFSEMAINDLS